MDTIGGGNLARKTTTSSEVKYRWIKANYKQYQVNFRYDTDKELIDYIEKRKEHGDSNIDIFREAVEALIEKENPSA